MLKAGGILGLGIAVASVSLAPASYVTMVDHGPTTNRVDAVFLGDGYTVAQLGGAYLTHIDAMLDQMFRDGEQPFPRYESFFNVHRIDLASNESGADVPPEGVFRDTALDATYFYDGVTDRLLYINQPKADDALRANIGRAFRAEMKLVTVNSTRYGGGGGAYAVYSGGNDSAPEVALHELGHSFAGLADEYDYGGGEVYTGGEPSEPNATKSSTGAKWAHWLGYTERGVGPIGAYEGARYYQQDIFRPSDNSKMRSLNRPFDAVSREEIILDIYDFVDPLDDWLENAETLDNPASLWVDAVDPDVIDVRWLVDGVDVPGAAGESFDPRQFGFDAGDYVITAFAEDLTPWVRIERESLQQAVSWTVHLDPPNPLPGDVNGDGAVDLTDLNLVRNHFGDSGDPVEGDSFPYDGQVDLADLNAVRDHFGEAGSAPVPEPGTISLGVFAMALGAARYILGKGAKQKTGMDKDAKPNSQRGQPSGAASLSVGGCAGRIKSAKIYITLQP